MINANFTYFSDVVTPTDFKTKTTKQNNHKLEMLCGQHMLASKQQQSAIFTQI